MSAPRHGPPGAPAAPSPFDARGAALLLTGVFACSTSVIFIKESTVTALQMTGWRLTLAALLLLPAFLREQQVHRAAWRWRDLVRSFLPGVLLAVHLLTWAVGARLTSAANASLIVNLVPLVTPFLLHALTHERLDRREWTATGVGIAGVAVLSVGDLSLGRDTLAGDATCLGSMVLFAVYMVMAKQRRTVPGLWLYLVPLYAVAGLLSLAVAALGAAAAATSPALLDATLFPLPWAVGGLREWLLLLGLALVPTIIGHSSLNACMRRLRGQLVSVANTFQFVFAALLAWFLLAETPSPAFYPAAALVTLGTLLLLPRRAPTRSP